MIACARQAGELQQEVNGLLAVSRFCLHADRRACLEATEDVLARSQALEDDTFKALVQGSSASINLYLKGWRERDANLCAKAIELTADAHDHGTLIRRYGIEGILDCWRSRYQECRRAGTEGKRLAREAGDVYIFVLFNVLEFDRADLSGRMARVAAGNHGRAGTGEEKRQSIRPVRCVA